MESECQRRTVALRSSPEPEVTTARVASMQEPPCANTPGIPEKVWAEVPERRARRATGVTGAMRGVCRVLM